MRASTELLNDVSALIDFSEGDLRRLMSTWWINGKVATSLTTYGLSDISQQGHQESLQASTSPFLCPRWPACAPPRVRCFTLGTIMNTIASNSEVAGMVEETRLIRLEMMKSYAIFAKIESKVRVSHHLEKPTPESCPNWYQLCWSALPNHRKAIFEIVFRSWPRRLRRIATMP
jgi:hypothetical protein